MNLSRIFIGKLTPERIAGLFKALMTLQIIMYLFHFLQTFRTWNGKWSWSGEINHWQFDPTRTWNKRFQFADSVEATYRKLDLSFTFASFQEWFNGYMISFLIADLLKLAISIFVFWQLSKAITNKSAWGFQVNQAQHHFPNTLAVKGDFKGFTTEGVKRLRWAALPIMLMPILNYFTNW